MYDISDCLTAPHFAPPAGAIVNNMPHGGTLIVMPPTLIDQWCACGNVPACSAAWLGVTHLPPLPGLASQTVD
jgi:hypothetical protein